MAQRHLGPVIDPRSFRKLCTAMSSESQWSHHREWPPEPGYVHESRDFVCRHLTDHGLPQLRADAVLVVSELTTNAVRHAGTPFGVTLQRSESTVTLQVDDATSRAPDLPGGDPLRATCRGLRLVGAVTDSWGVTPTVNGGKSIWASFEVDAAAAMSR